MNEKNEQKKRKETKKNGQSIFVVQTTQRGESIT